MREQVYAQKVLLAVLLLMGLVVAFAISISSPLGLEPINNSLPPPSIADEQQAACRPPDEIEQQRDQLALHLLQTFQPDDSWSLLREAMMTHFAQPHSARRGERGDVCPPTHLYADVASAAISAGMYDKPFLGTEPIALARRIGPESPRIVDAIIRTAFFSRPIVTSTSPDLRGDARVLLADFCKLNPALTIPAFQDMSFKTRSGRAAARAAVACGNREALAVVSGWMQQLLDSARYGAIEQSKSIALFDLAYALEVAGVRAQPYAGPISALLDRKIQAWAPPFGMLDISPTSMCAIAGRIGGAVAEEARAKSVCQ